MLEDAVLWYGDRRACEVLGPENVDGRRSRGVRRARQEVLKAIRRLERAVRMEVASQ